MADDILKNSLSGLSSQPLPDVPRGLQAPDMTGNAGKDIASLSGAQQKPSALLNLQKALQVGSSEAYKQRQATEMGITAEQFDPTKVSGGTFAGIIGNLEQQRGMDIGKVYSSTMNTYVRVQEQITQRLQFMQQMEEDKRRWEEEMDLKEKEYKLLKKRDAEAAKQFKETMEEDKRRFEMNYALDSKKAAQSGSSGYSSGFLEEMAGDFGSINMGPDSYLDPYQTNSWAQEYLSKSRTKQDLAALNTMMTKAKQLMKPDDDDKPKSFYDEIMEGAENNEGN